MKKSGPQYPGLPYIIFAGLDCYIQGEEEGILRK